MTDWVTVMLYILPFCSAVGLIVWLSSVNISTNHPSYEDPVHINRAIAAAISTLILGGMSYYTLLYYGG